MPTPLAGGGDCFPTPEDCRLLALGRGQTEDLVYGVDGKTYRINVTKIALKVTSKPPKG